MNLGIERLRLTLRKLARGLALGARPLAGRCDRLGETIRRVIRATTGVCPPLPASRTA